jgi:hypothetical protein
MERVKQLITSSSLDSNSTGVQKYVTITLLGSRFEARNCIGEPGPQEPLKKIACNEPNNLKDRFILRPFKTELQEINMKLLNFFFQCGATVKLWVAAESGFGQLITGIMTPWEPKTPSPPGWSVISRISQNTYRQIPNFQSPSTSGF